MTKKNIKISIGIPAFNEERNIIQLLKSLLLQKQQGFVIKEIIVISDGSTDKTIHAVRSTHDQRITCIASKKRIGKSGRMQQLIKKFSGDVLFLLDADIVIPANDLIATIMEQIDVERDGLIAVNTQPLPARNFFEKTINASAAVQSEIRKHWNNGQNYLAFKGCLFILSKNFSRQITLHRDLVNNDAYLYFSARRLGYSPRYLLDTIVYYRSPATLSDHILQSSRFATSRKELAKYFGATIKKEYAMPKKIVIKQTLKHFFSSPITISLYFVIVGMSIILREKQIISSTWNIALSTKTTHISKQVIS